MAMSVAQFVFIRLPCVFTRCIDWTDTPLLKGADSRLTRLFLKPVVDILAILFAVTLCRVTAACMPDRAELKKDILKLLYNIAHMQKAYPVKDRLLNIPV